MSDESDDKGTGDDGSEDALAAALADAAAARAELKTHNDAAAAREAQAKADKAVADGKAAEALTLAQKTIEDGNKALEAYKARDTVAAGELIKSFPDNVKQRVNALADKFSDPADWLKYLKTEQAGLPKGDDVDPKKPVSRGDGKVSRKEKKYKVSNREFLEDRAGIEVRHIEDADFVETRDGYSFEFPLRKFLAKANIIGGHRDGGGKAKSKVVK